MGAVKSCFSPKGMEGALGKGGGGRGTHLPPPPRECCLSPEKWNMFLPIM